MEEPARLVKTILRVAVVILVFCVVYAVVTFVQRTKVTEVKSPSEKYYNEGMVCAKKNDYKGALKMFESAIKADPNNPSAYNSAANCAINTGDFDKAKEYAEIALKLDPTSLYAHFNLADAYYNLKRYDLAKENYKMALSESTAQKCPEDIMEMINKRLEELK